MTASRTALIALVLVAAPLAACASDETRDIEPTEEDVPFDPTVDTGVDTEVEKSENLGLDGDDA